ncbi:MAG: hypothetical protein KC561_00780 [Myxococcales bacterium]|nr:hypothetical protein [Myxococcales bacterium]
MTSDPDELDDPLGLGSSRHDLGDDPLLRSLDRRRRLTRTLAWILTPAVVIAVVVPLGLHFWALKRVADEDDVGPLFSSEEAHWGAVDLALIHTDLMSTWSLSRDSAERRAAIDGLLRATTAQPEMSALVARFADLRRGVLNLEAEGRAIAD